MPFLTKKTQGSLEEWLMPLLVQEMYRRNLRDLILVESRGGTKHSWGHSEDPLQGLLVPKAGQFEHLYKNLQ